MKLIICTLVGAAFLIVSVIAGRQARIRGIDITQPEEGYQSSIKPVHGLRSCGGPGKVVEWRVGGCAPDKICRMPSEGPSVNSELEFVPSQDVDTLGIRFGIVTDGEASVVYERPIAGSAVQGGERYIASSLGRANKELKGKLVTAQYILYRVDDDNVEVCAEADFEIY